MATKHDLILEHIESLPVGEKISVRGIAKALSVSEGTAYRAIKDAENLSLVSTIERVGTIRIERKLKKDIEKLTFDEVLTIVEGTVLGGATGLNKELHKFVIGAMTTDAMERYITPDSLMIVGNRTNVHELALEKGAAVLVTGGFDTTPEIADLSDRLQLPIIQTAYDTFTVATMINRALSDRLIKKEILLVGDIYTKLDQTAYLLSSGTVADYKALAEKTQHHRFPVVNKQRRVVGVVTAKDMIEKNDQQSLEKVMTKTPRVAKETMSIASVSHQMIWDGLEIMPVVADDFTLLGIVTRQDVMQAMQVIQRQPQVGDTLSDQIKASLYQRDRTLDRQKYTIPSLHFQVSPQMVDETGTIAFGVLSEIFTTAAKRTMQENQRRNVWMEQLNVHYFHLIQLESELVLQPRILEMGRHSAKLDIEAYVENSLVAKALIVCQVLMKK